MVEPSAIRVTHNANAVRWFHCVHQHLLLRTSKRQQYLAKAHKERAMNYDTSLIHHTRTNNAPDKMCASKLLAWEVSPSTSIITGR
jgi:hypothetical protein